MSTKKPGGHRDGFLKTLRNDNWWAGPAATFGVLSAFIVYATWAAFQAEHYYAISYLSPLYSPPIWIDTAALGHAPLEHAWAGAWPEWWPKWVPSSPAFIILAFPGAFRLTCYYYRKAYYRSFAFTPPACAVGPIREPGKYRGETAFLIFQNLHRYALPFAIALVFILYYDAYQAFWYEGEFGFGVGTFVLFMNATLLGAYTFGCHSFRHLIGGNANCFSCDAVGRARHQGWSIATFFNGRHMQFAWVSLVWVGFSDVYVRLVSMGVIDDINTWGV